MRRQMATIVRREVRRRGFVGKLFLGLFWLFNGLMLWWFLDYCWRISSIVSPADSDAARAGAAIGVTMAVGMIAFFWVAGAVILGLFAILTRGARVTIEEHR